MKNEPTALELFQKQQIEALQQKVLELENEIKQRDIFTPSSSRIIDVKDPIFLKPLTEAFPLTGTYAHT